MTVKLTRSPDWSADPDEIGISAIPLAIQGFKEQKMVPEEHSYRAPKRLIFAANWQCKITGTINSTNTSCGKGWMSADSGKFALLDCGLVVAIRRAKGMIIVVAKLLVFLETLLDTISRHRHPA